MGYHIDIGNGVERIEDEETGLEMCVDTISLPNAPCFPNDPTSDTNSRTPSYHTWALFCTETGLFPWYYNPDRTERWGYPGHLVITKAEIETVSHVLQQYGATVNDPPGFDQAPGIRGPVQYNGNLARLLWLQWWMTWAIENCPNPVVVIK